MLSIGCATLCTLFARKSRFILGLNEDWSKVRTIELWKHAFRNRQTKEEGEKA